MKCGVGKKIGLAQKIVVQWIQLNILHSPIILHCLIDIIRTEYKASYQQAKHLVAANEPPAVSARYPCSSGSTPCSLL